MHTKDKIHRMLCYSPTSQKTGFTCLPRWLRKHRQSKPSSFIFISRGRKGHAE